MAANDDRALTFHALKRVSRFAVAAMVMSLVATACSSHGSPTTPAASGVQALPRGMRYEKGIPIPLPARATTSKDVDPVHDLGEDIFITKDGFKPQSLTAKVEAQLWIHNETDTTQVVRFVNWPWSSPPIEPGAKAIYVPHETVAVNYVLGSNQKVAGSVLFEPWYDPNDPNAPPNPTAAPK